MSYTDKKIIETYHGLFDGLSMDNKIELIESLSKSLKKSRRNREKSFYSSFGAFASDKSPEKIIKEIKAGRTFRKKDITF